MGDNENYLEKNHEKIKFNFDYFIISFGTK